MENQLKKLMLGLVAYAALRDIPAERLLGSSHIDLVEIQDLSTALDDKQVSDLWLNVLHLSKDKLFGLHFGESLQLAALGIVGEIIKTSEMVGDALTTAAKLTHLITDAIRLEVIRHEHYFSVLFIPANQHWQQDKVTVQMLDLLLVLVIHELDGLILKKLSPVWVGYTGQLDKIDEYARVLRCRPEQNETYTELRFDDSFWHEKIITSNYQHQRFLLQQLRPMIQMDSSKSTFTMRITEYLRANSYMGMLTLEDIASNFNLSPRTLQRRLHQENTTFQQLADDVRKAQALSYLKDGSYQGKEISYMLGYNELSAFTRTFKRWTGLTPTAFQDNFLKSHKPG